MPESDSTKELELYSRDGNVTTVRSPVRLQILRLMREGDDVTFSEIQEATGLSKSTVSNYLNSLDEAGLIARVPDPNDARKKIYRLSSTYLGQVDPTTYAAPAEYRELIRQTYTNYDRIDYKEMLPHIFRVALAESGIRIDPVLKRGGIILGEAVAPYVVADSLDKTIENIQEFWVHYGFGEVQAVSTAPLVLDVYKCYECMTLPKGISGGCIISKGMFSALFSAFFRCPVQVKELACMTDGSECCRFEIRPKML
ncbi:MarR family transcriptional regulator [Methanocorpusculaceae archaeon]|nr:MarR family transcriptional regulator [Methanocorpusculaceae archaeon]MBO5118471.1 MarR family transcriptional regulator [Methanocorpusculum sp.]